MSTPLYAPRPGRVQVYGARGGEYTGHPDLTSYWETMRYVRGRVSRVQWEDIDPDCDPTIPMKPKWCFTNVEEPDELRMLELFLEGKAESIWDTEQQRERRMSEAHRRVWAEARHARAQQMIANTLFTLDMNYDLLELYDSSITVSKRAGDCWRIGADRVTLYDTTGAAHTVPAILAMTLLSDGQTVSLATVYRRQRDCWQWDCCRPSHWVAQDH